MGENDSTKDKNIWDKVVWNKRKLSEITIDEFVEYLLCLSDEKISEIKQKQKSKQNNNLTQKKIAPFIMSLTKSKYFLEDEEFCNMLGNNCDKKNFIEEKLENYYQKLKEKNINGKYIDIIKKRCENINALSSNARISIIIIKTIFPASGTDYSGTVTDNGFKYDLLKKYNGDKKLKTLLDNVFSYGENFDSTSKDFKMCYEDKENYYKNINNVLEILFDKETIEDVEKRRMENNKMSNPEEKVKDLINNGSKQIIFTGAPGTGKTYIAKKIASGDEKHGEVNGKCYEFVQFHPSYDYTDFVEGLRPVKIGEKTEFVKIDGIFKKFCREVVKYNKEKTGKKPNNNYYFIIDEINRADLSKVFGELMYCLESDKRGEVNKVNTQYQNIDTYYKDTNEKQWKAYKEEDDVFADGFYIPENVIILGTMNDIDRSVESMDFALRRRFDWVEFEVTKETLESAFTATGNNNKPIYGELICSNNRKIIERIMALNEKIINGKGKELGLNRHYAISQGQFAHLENLNINNIDDLLDHVWEYKIKSLLEEYVRGEDEQQIEDFIKDCENVYLKENYSNKNSDNNSASDNA